MRLPLLAVLFCSLLVSCASPSAGTQPEKRGSILTRWIPHFWGGGHVRKDRRATGRLDLDLSITPLPLNLSQVRRMSVNIRLVNRGKRLVQLQFPTSQRIEVVVLDEKGAKIVQWSEDQLFEPAVSYLSVNPGERVQYDLKVATRDLVAGRLYTVEAFVPGHEALKDRVTLSPKP